MITSLQHILQLFARQRYSLQVAIGANDKVATTLHVRAHSVSIIYIDILKHNRRETR